MLSYGLGDAGTGLAATQLGFYLFTFFTSTAGLPAFMAGSLLMVIKVWDAINDPLIGWLSDHTKSKWGPRIPWMIGAAVPLGLSLAAIWWVPPGNTFEKTSYYIFITVILMTAYTSVNLPFAALATEITEDTSIRTRLNAARFTGSILAGLTGLVVAASLLSSGNNGYVQMGRITGLIATCATLISCWGLSPFAKKARKPIITSEPIKFQFQRIYNNKKFLKIIGLYLLLWCGLQLMQTVSLIYLEQVMRVPTEISKWIPVPFQLSALVGLQFWSLYSNKNGRIKALFKGSFIWITACLIAMILPPISSGVDFQSLLILDNSQSWKMVMLLITILCLGFGASTAYLIPWSLLPDAIDADPDKPAGIYTAWMVLIQKIGIGISVQLLGLLLSLSGYRSSNDCVDLVNCMEQSDTAITTIRICMGLIPTLLVVLGLLIMKNWSNHNNRPYQINNL
ncbi:MULTISPECIES: MFS transporter [Prochlorococcus]|uniref:Na+/galactoside symporter n=1 Tax=Prochlorococcus marinus (strain SARG / CCMP1375 / SS120) TaxID=167539 RepID=Q7VAQ3_PROMA|nr:MULTISPECIES: MFS transporter [Prochlorococcus]AAQ00448.1 Na+/galactoside symporter [Prochlorococcus marinus subsp. marinus str. CCMP1375]KGG22097.1 hypothetical protein EV08_0271 [Prochlorococcus marinus str. SS2]KGG24585.1 hypothetical protein EV09_0217 [Prochlorococcus marinus str. SS35]KGG33478.1 hypothetical protein EV10_0687 [Prochlorococcus marinus str. SS51]KGG37396.1 hypothetical protein EV11_0272 [Prochlorococcus sp. SS52]